MHWNFNTVMFFFLFFCISPSFAQQWSIDRSDDIKYGREKTFFEIQKEFNDYWGPKNVTDGYYYENGEKIKAGGWKQFKRWEWFWSNRVDPVSGDFPKTSASRELQLYLERNPILKSKNETTSSNWSSLGPNSTNGGYANLGRLNCVAFSPSKQDVIYVGAASGGVWKSIDNGLSWTPMSDNIGALGISDIIVVQGNSADVLYAATGDRDAGDTYSVGVLKSTDGGISWNATGLNWNQSSYRRINRLLVDPSNTNILYAASTNGFYKTTDGGVTWTQKNSKNFINIKFKPGNSQILYGSSSGVGEIYRSIDGGNTWSLILKTDGSRVELAITEANPLLIYAVIGSSSNGLFGVFKSINGGDSFSQIAGSTPNMLGWYDDGSDTGGQAWYDLCIAADPKDAEIVLVGGIKTWRSVDGGNSWSVCSSWNLNSDGTTTSVHVDQHYLAYQSGTTTLFECNDGGLYKSSNSGSTWTNLASGLVISQMYRLGSSQNSPDEVLTGLQDNGTKSFHSDIWSDVLGGDGMECLIDYTDNNIQYGEYQNGYLSRTVDHWRSITDISTSLTDKTAWVTPFVIDPNNSSTLYVGRQNVWKTTDKGTNWSKISSWTGWPIISLAIASSNSNTIFAATSSILYKTINGGTDWTNITGNIPVNSNSITYISVKSDDPNTLWVSLGQFNANGVFKSIDGGGTWTNISSGLPSIPVNCLIQNRLSSSQVELYAGTDVGVFVKVGNTNWIPYFTGLPNVVVSELEIYYGSEPGLSKIRAATYGRGLWESKVFTDYIGNPPLNLTAASGDSQVILNWDPPAGTIVPSNYKIFRNNAETGFFNLVDIVSSRTYIDQDRLNQATYWYYITAVYSAPSGESAPSTKASAIPWSVNDPTDFKGTPASHFKINLSWTKNGLGSPVMVAIAPTSIFGTPVNGTLYSPGQTIPGGGTVIYNGPLSKCSSDGLASNRTYYYKAWSVLSGNSFSQGVVIDVNTGVNDSDSLALVALYNKCSGLTWSKKSNWMTGKVETWEGVKLENGRVVELNLGDWSTSIGLSGSLPDEVSHLTAIRILNLQNNELTDSLPESWSALVNLNSLDLGFNQLTGLLPASYSSLTNLRYLALYYNQLTGSLPESWSALVNLNNLYLMNNQLEGGLPANWSSLLRLSALDLSSNQLSGPFPDSWSSLVNLWRLSLNSNQISHLPDLKSLTYLSYLDIENNLLDFGDIEPNISVPKSGFTYSPQAPVGNADTLSGNEGNEIRLSVNTAGKSNIYQWFFNGIEIPGCNSSEYIIHSAEKKDIGVYTCQIRNTVATALTLTSKPITVQIVVSISKELSAGWTWFSLNVIDKDMSVDKVLGGLKSNEGDYVKNQTVSATYYNGTGWFGELSQFNPKEMYKIKLANSDTLKFLGTTVNPLSYPISVKTGWNWIGCLPQSSASVANALYAISPVADDYIKNQIKSSTYYDGSGWFGELNNLDPLDGYMLKTSHTGTLVFHQTGTFTDNRDGNIYRWLQMGNQTWMAENLAYLSFVSPATAGSDSLPFYYVYSYQGNSSNEAKTLPYYSTYGVLYNWVAAKTACPSGWHLPSDPEWTILTDYLTNNGLGYGGSGDDIGKSLAAQVKWYFYSTIGTVGNDLLSNNISGFTAIPAGYRNTYGSFSYLNYYTGFWSATQDGDLSARSRTLYYTYNTIIPYSAPKNLGYSVRCLKD